eukprot:gene7224-12907_t
MFCADSNFQKPNSESIKNDFDALHTIVYIVFPVLWVIDLHSMVEFVASSEQLTAPLGQQGELLLTSNRQLVNIEDDGYLSLMDDNGDQKEDVRVPENDCGKEIQSKFDLGESILVTILTSMGEEAAVGTKPMNS